MTENKTSQAVQDMSDRCSKWFQAADNLLDDRVTIPWKQWQAYAAKYQRMEEALEAVLDNFDYKPCDGEPCSKCRAMRAAKDSLSFDPLASNA